MGPQCVNTAEVAIHCRKDSSVTNCFNGAADDRMLCRPKYRDAFLHAAKLVTGVEDEETLLWSVVNLRKRKSLPAVMK